MASSSQKSHEGSKRGSSGSESGSSGSKSMPLGTDATTYNNWQLHELEKQTKAKDAEIAWLKAELAERDQRRCTTCASGPVTTCDGSPITKSSSAVEMRSMATYDGSSSSESSITSARQMHNRTKEKQCAKILAAYGKNPNMSENEKYELIKDAGIISEGSSISDSDNAHNSVLNNGGADDSQGSSAKDPLKKELEQAGMLSGDAQILYKERIQPFLEDSGISGIKSGKSVTCGICEKEVVSERQNGIIRLPHRNLVTMKTLLATINKQVNQVHCIYCGCSRNATLDVVFDADNAKSIAFDTQGSTITGNFEEIEFAGATWSLRVVVQYKNCDGGNAVFWTENDGVWREMAVESRLPMKLEQVQFLVYKRKEDQPTEDARENASDA